MTTPRDPRVDELRQRLRSLGYLDAGVDRFVLAPATGSRRPWSIALLASLRIGILAALLLGPAASIGVVSRLPGLITGTRDAFVAALYLGILFGSAAALAAVIASVIVAFAGARRARTLAVITGGAVSIACLIYLTLWWESARVVADAGWSGAAWTVFALAFAAAISLLIGHAVTVTALAVSVARSGEAPGARGVPGASWRTAIIGVALALCGALLLFNLSASLEGDAGPDAAPLTVVSSGARIRLFAVDGFDRGIFDQLSARGRMPALTRMISGAQASLAPEDSRDPARFWTTVATGMMPDAHGVQGLETRRVAGLQGTMPASDRSGIGRTIRAATDLVRLTRPSIASGTERRVKTLWEVASSAGLRTAVVNWWATWPAPAQAGIVLTDRAALRLERGGALDAEIAPPEIYEQLRARWPALQTAAAQRAAMLSTTAAEPIAAMLRRSAQLDAEQLMLMRAIASADIDLACVYLPGLDLVQHALLAPGDGASVNASAIAARLSALEDYYVYLDGMLAPALASEAETVVLIAGPGRVETPSTTTIAVRGGMARRDANANGRVADLMPTLLYALGVPVSRDLAGQPLLGIFDEQFAARYPIRQVETYGRPANRPSARAGEPLDQEMLDRLRSLGYVR
jgi:hypothetical protein